MKKHIKPTALVILTLVMLIAGAMVTMIVGYASDYYTYTFYYQYEDGTTAHDPYIAVFEKNSKMNLTVKKPDHPGISAVRFKDARRESRHAS